MTTDRRRARGGSPLSKIDIDGALAPAELTNPSAACWQDDAGYDEWLEAHGLTSSLVTYRAGAPSSPCNRRNDAAVAWAEKAGVLLDDRSPTPTASWHKLRASGFIY